MINRNNYEEFLLMYVDGELSDTQRNEVIAFLEANPDLKQELELLQQTILQPEADLQFTGKASLYKEANGIHAGNYEEQFLLYVDNELNAAEKESVETFVLQHPELQDEFTALKKAVLPNDWVPFTHKELLYRKEEKRRPAIISMRWASLAAAAMIGIVALVWIFNIQENTNPVAGKLPQTQQPANPAAIEQVQKTPGTESRQLPVAITSGSTTTVGNTPEQQQPDQQLAINPQPQQPAYTEPVVIAANTNPVTDYTNTTTVNTGLSDSGNEKVVHTASPEVTDNNDDVQPAVFKEELNTEDENKNVYVGAMQINPDKVRGFLRKAGRFLSGKIKPKEDDENGKLQVANFEINKLK